MTERQGASQEVSRPVKADMLAEFDAATLTPPSGGSPEAPDELSLPDELPMVVWLRGDEAYVADFSLGADDVMLRLGIRRSRLTQISGRELRVGRIRKGKYISPVFRPQDVDAYERWTRATATHLKSSTILSDAANALGKHGQEISARLGDAVRAVATNLDEVVQRTVAMTTAAMHERTSMLQSGIARLESFVNEARFAQSALKTRLDELGQKRGQEAAALLSMARDVTELASLMRVMRADALAERAAVEARAAALAEDVASLRQVLEPRAAEVARRPSRSAKRRMAKVAGQAGAKSDPVSSPPVPAARSAGNAAANRTISREKRSAQRAKAAGRLRACQRSGNDAPR